MRDDWEPPTSEDVARSVTITRYPSGSATWAQLIADTAAGGQDLSPYVTECRQRSAELSLTLAWAAELYGEGQPVPGDLVRVALDGQALWHGQIEAISDYREQRGGRRMSVTARSRDASPLWRAMRWVTNLYPVGTDLSVIVGDILTALGLSADERTVAPSGIRTVHSGTQLADVTAWEMLTGLLFAIRCRPWTDALGRFKAVSRDVTREADLAIAQGRLLRIRGSRSRPPITGYRLKWLDPNLSRSSQQAQVLGRESITAGFFKLEQKRDVYWSEDRRQRAENTFMRVVQSVNSGLLPVGTEEYEQVDEYHGRVTVTTSAWVPLLNVVSIGALLAASKLPDIAPTGGGPTIPTGKVVQGAAEAAIMLTMMSLGTGTYEIWGEPFDYIHAINRTEAYNDAAPGWARNELEEQNDYVMGEEHAQELAVSELLHRSYAAQTWGADVVDDPRIEVGDIVTLPDGSRLYIEDYSRDLKRGAAAVLALEGFRV